MKIQDTVTLADAQVTDKGYLEAFARAARTGVQVYTGDEMGRPDMATVRVYRPDESVFDKASLQTFADADVTIGHPAEPVDAATWKDKAVGEVYGGALRDGEWVKFGLRIRDAGAIKSVQDGVRELSVGYTAEIEWKDGISPSGEAYDAIQKNIKANHVAIVPRARAGSDARIGDEDAGKDRASWGASPINHVDEGDAEMADNLQTVVVGDKAVQVSAADAAILDAFKASMTKELSDAKAAHKTEIDAKDEEIGTLKADLKKAQDSAPDQSAIDKMVADRAALVSTVAKVAKDVKPDGMSDADLRKAAVAAKLGDDAVKDVSDAEIKGMFAVVARDADKSDPVADALKDGGGKQTVDDGWGSVLPMKKEA